MLPVIHETAYINSTVPDITMPYALPSKREQPLGADLHWRRRVIWLRRLGSFASGHDAECAVLIGRILASRLRFTITLRVAVCIVCCLFYLYNLLIWTQVHQHIYGKNGDLHHYIIMCWSLCADIKLITYIWLNDIAKKLQNLFVMLEQL